MIDELSVDAIRAATEDGRLCCECGTEFVEAHGKKVACAFCWSRLSLNEQHDIPKATHDEANRAAHANEARQRRQQRND